jgi:hypothetical protein
MTGTCARQLEVQLMEGLMKAQAYQWNSLGVQHVMVVFTRTPPP